MSVRYWLLYSRPPQAKKISWALWIARGGETRGARHCNVRRLYRAPRPKATPLMSLIQDMNAAGKIRGPKVKLSETCVNPPVKGFSLFFSLSHLRPRLPQHPDDAGLTQSRTFHGVFETLLVMAQKKTYVDWGMDLGNVCIGRGEGNLGTRQVRGLRGNTSYRARIVKVTARLGKEVHRQSRATQKERT